MTAPARRTLRWEVRRSAVLIIATLGASVLVGLGALALALGSIRPDLQRSIAAGRAIRLAHEAMLDQHSGLVGYLASDDPRYLEADRRGAERLPARRGDIRRHLGSDLGPELTAFERSMDAWLEGWAEPVRAAMAAGAVRAGAGSADIFGRYRSAKDTLEAAVDDRGADLHVRRDRLLVVGLGTSLVLVATTFGVVRRRQRLLERYLVEPVDDLLATMRRLREGDLTARARSTGPEELRQIGRGLGEVARSLEAYRARLAEGRRHVEEARDLAQAASEAKTAFLATMSHEIRTPMNAVIGLTDLLLETPLSAQQRDYAATIRMSGEVLLAIINDILDFSKIEAGRTDLESRPFDLRDCLQSAVDLVAPQAGAKGLDLRFVLDEATPTALVGDSARLRQIVLNLVGNAVKFTASGEVVLRASGAHDGDGHVDLRIDVRDTGIGIAPEHVGRLFQSFTQLETSTTREFGGTGLGLAISARLAQAMGGEITVDSVPGQGSTFCVAVRLARAPAPVPRDRRLSNAGRWAEAAEPAPALRALLVDDSPVNLTVGSRMLESLGHTVDVVRDGPSALAALVRKRYDVALVDLYMPAMDGVELIRAIRTQVPGGGRLTIAVMSASVLDEDRQRAAEAGADAFLPKPVRLDDLDRTLRSLPSGADGGMSGNDGHRAPDETAPDETTIDEPVLGRLATVLGTDAPAALARLVETYAQQGDSLVRDLRRAVADGDREGLRRSAHTLKGSSSSLGAATLPARCARLESAAAVPADLAHAVEGVAGEHERVKLALRRYCAQLDVPRPAGGDG